MNESHEHAHSSPDDAPVSPIGMGRSASAATRLDTKVLGAAACIFLPGTLWSMEPWQRPDFMRVVPDLVLFAVASIGVLGMALRVGCGGKTGARWRWVLAVCVCGFALLAGTRHFCGRLSLSSLASRIDQEISEHPGAIPEEPRKPISARLVDILEGLRLGAPDWLTTHAERRSAFKARSLPQEMIAASRWPLRRAMADSLVKNHTRAKFLIRNWKDYFPAIIGADFSLEHRREWISRLNALLEDDSLTVTSRQATVFCMALVVLTDPPEFENWRVPVRDAMLGWREPLAAETEDVWMRTIDTLLALDPHESWVGLTESLISSHDGFRYAMRVPVRGLAGNFDSHMREFEQFESRNQTEHGFALWQGAGASLEHWPEAFGKEETAIIRDWRRDVLFRWLMDHSRGTRKELAETRGRVLMDFPPEQQRQLAISAAKWARMACEQVATAAQGADLTDSRPFKIVRLLYPYLAGHQQAEIGRLLVPVMLRPDLFHKPGPMKSVQFESHWTELLWKIRPLMNAEERGALHLALIPLMANLSPGRYSSAVLLCMDAWSETPVLKPERWLASAWHNRLGWRIVPGSTPIESLDPFDGGPLPIPPVADQAVETLARLVDEASATGTTGFMGRLHQGLNGVESTTPSSKFLSYLSERQIRNWESSGVLASHPPADLLRMELYLRGLCKLDDKGMRDLKEIAANRTMPFSSEFGHLLYRTENPSNPWSDALQDPQKAAHEAVQWIGHLRFHSLSLNDLVFWVEKSRPDEAVVRAVWDALRQRSHSAPSEDKPEIFGTLFRLSPMLPRDERMAMRRDFFAAHRNEESHSRAFNDGDGYDGDIYGDPLEYPGGGTGIPWEDDELSANLSLSSNIGRLTHLVPPEPTDMHSNSAFRFLALGVFPKYKINPLTSELDRHEMPPLSKPFEPTPWQRARELHLRRPDLDVR